MKNQIVESDVANILSNPIIDWKRFENKTVLITGANGMLPAYLVFTLLALRTCKVIALVRNKTKAEAKFKDYLDDKNLKLIVQDVCEPIKIEEPIHFIIHAASQASPKYYGVDPVGTINANVLGTIKTLNLAREKQVEGYLYFSSGEIYGQIPSDKMPFDENCYGNINLTNVRSCYCESKRMGEQLCVAYNYQYKVPTRMIRIFHTYGPGMLLDDGRVFADFCKNIVNGEDIVMHSDGSAKRPFCYISDAVIAYIKVLLDGKDANAYNIANTEAEISMKELAKELTMLYPEKNINVKTIINDNDMRTGKMKSPVSRILPDCSKINQLGWKPIVDISEIFRWHSLPAVWKVLG